MQCAAEEICCRTESINSVSSAYHPCAFTGVFRGNACLARDGKVPHVGIIGVLLFAFEVVGSSNGHGHVRLSTAEPYFAHDNVVNGYRLIVLVRRRYHKGLSLGTYRHAFQPYHPFSVLAHFPGYFLATELYGDLFTRIRPAPDWNFLALLEYHVVAYQRGEFDLGKSRQRGEYTYYQSHEYSFYSHVSPFDDSKIVVIRNLYL